jgi:hypothetical protein
MTFLGPKKFSILRAHPFPMALEMDNPGSNALNRYLNSYVTAGEEAKGGQELSREIVLLYFLLEQKYE